MKHIIYSLITTLVLLWSCEPITDRDSLGGVLNESELKLEIYSTSEGGNKIVVVNKTYGIGSYWETSVGTSTRQRDTFLLPYRGQHQIIFKGICSGGIVKTSRQITVNKIDHPLAIQWEYFAGKDGNGKTWEWDYSAMTDPIWGNGGYLWDIGPGWSKYDANYFSEKFPSELKQTLNFNLNGGAIISKNNADGTPVQSGSFTFDMTKTTTNGWGEGLWAQGKLYLNNVNVMHGIAPNQQNAPVYTYDILYLDNQKMVLAYPEPGIGSGGTCWYWKFKVKK